ncbi:MAG TPA: hypothetical protein PLF81_24575 [Candidatus Anammoximicrobium sp.]|nr:hypothetical protein [Candidatus Anammoximicrobium sp.]
MNRTRHAFTLLAPLLLFAGCIVGDELTTITLQPDGSAEMVTFRSNLRSTQPGQDGERELANYKATFESRTQDDMARIRAAGATVVQASWVREQVPLSNVVSARFPDAAALEKFGTSKNDDGSLQITTQWESDGAHRRLLVRITAAPGALDLSQFAKPSLEKLRQHLADGISGTRIAVAGGAITGARGFAVAGDRQSALLDLSEIAKLLQANGGKTELSLDWEVTQ